MSTGFIEESKIRVTAALYMINNPIKIDGDMPKAGFFSDIPAEFKIKTVYSNDYQNRRGGHIKCVRMLYSVRPCTLYNDKFF